MKNLLKYVAVGAIGAIVGQIIINRDVENGDLVYEDDDMYVKTSKSRTYGYSLARVNWKHIDKKKINF